MHNKLDYTIPVYHWEHFHILRKIALSKPVSTSDEGWPKKQPEVTEWDFVWVRTTPQPLAGLSLTDLETNPTRFQPYALHSQVRRWTARGTSRARDEEANLCDGTRG